MNALLSRIRRAAIDPHAADGPLLAAYLEGDNEAFAALVRRYAGLVFGACRRVLRHQQDAEDAFQATFLVLARRAADVWPREAVGAWLFGVAHRVALKARATRTKRDSRHAPLSETPAPDAPDPNFDLAEAVQRVVAKLPDVYRAAVVACDLEGLSRKCAAERLGWSEGTLSGRLARARQLLAKRLAHLGGAVPALAVALGPVPAARAEAVQSAIDLSAGTAVSAPVLALSQGVVHGMFATKLKLAVAAVLATCALGFGTLSASGNGSEGDGTQPGAKGTGGAPTKPLAPPAPKEKTTPADLLQGSWRVTAITENGKATPTRATDPWVIEIRGATLTKPFQEAGTWKTRDYRFKAGTEGLVGTLDLLAVSAPDKPAGHGIYEFVVPQATCAKCHSGTVNVPAAFPVGVCAPALQALTPKSGYGVRLALALGGKRPATFGGEGVLVFDMERAAVDPAKAAQLEELLRERELRARIEAQRDRVAADARERERDKLRALAEQLDWLARQNATAEEAKLLSAKLEQAMVLAERAAQQMEVARQQAAMAQDVARAAEAQLAQAKAQQAELMAALEVLRKKAEGAKPPEAVGAATFTVHVRTLTAAEKVHKVKHTNQTILEAIVYAADDVPVKSDAVSVWIVRGKEVFTVDLPAILKNGDTKTNYVIKPGDQVFVQAKPAK